jgi:shikimate kinase
MVPLWLTYRLQVGKCDSQRHCPFMADEVSSVPRENIVLVGFMGSGKSSIGRLLAKRLGFQFLDTDHLIIERAGMPISEIFAQRGEPAFREMETSVLRSIMHLRRCVIATGGGAVIRDENRELLHQLGLVVGLTAAEDVIFDRVRRNSKRPLLQTEDPKGTLCQLLGERRPLYEEAAHWTLDTTSLTHDRAVSEIIGAARRAFSWHRAA